MRFHDFNRYDADPSWSFEKTRSVEQGTHGYHRYPAKFLPDVVKRIIEFYAVEGLPIADPFAGCGTTLVEAKMHGIEAHGVDINPVADLITRAKITPIPPQSLIDEFEGIINQFDNYCEENYLKLKKHPRIDYWFRPNEKYKIAFLYEKILEIRNTSIQDFFLVSLSHILKNCSRWLQSGTKPQIDPNKEPKDPFGEFKRHSRIMLQKNEEFYKNLMEQDYLDTPCEICMGDARDTKWADNSIGTIITSPPYVTSYEYADIHQLTGYWYEYISDLSEFRQKFIGTSYSMDKNDIDVPCALGKKIVRDLWRKSPRIASDVGKYFVDMSLVAKEMYRVLVPHGKACIVIGNTTVKDVDIKSAEVFWYLLKNVGFKKVEVIKRNIPHKLMPTIRDKRSGRFAKVDAPNSVKVYPNEFILIVEK